MLPQEGNHGNPPTFQPCLGTLSHIYVMRRGEGDLKETLLGRKGDPGAGVTLSKCLETGMNLEHGLGELQGRIVELSRPTHL